MHTHIEQKWEQNFKKMISGTKNNNRRQLFGKILKYIRETQLVEDVGTQYQKDMKNNRIQADIIINMGHLLSITLPIESILTKCTLMIINNNQDVDRNEVILLGKTTVTIENKHRKNQW